MSIGTILGLKQHTPFPVFLLSVIEGQVTTFIVKDLDE